MALLPYENQYHLLEYYYEFLLIIFSYFSFFPYVEGTSENLVVLIESFFLQRSKRKSLYLFAL